MKDLTLTEFLERLASADPTPGGGAASAIAAAAAASLLSMVARLSSGKGGDDTLLARLVALGDTERAAMVELANRDAVAFETVMQAMRLPKGTDVERERRQAAIQQALRGASDVPLEVASRGVTLLEASTALAGAGSLSAVSDVAVAALLAHAAVHGALFNVRINLRSIKDASYSARTAERARALGQRADVLRDEALATVGRRLAPRPVNQVQGTPGPGQA